MPKDELVYVGHMLDKAHEALSLVHGKTRQDYDSDSILRLALTHLIQVIGEAAGKVSERFRLEHSEIAWREITGMRHRLIHGYADVRLDVVWEVVQDQLPALVTALEPLLRDQV